MVLTPRRRRQVSRRLSRPDRARTKPYSRDDGDKQARSPGSAKEAVKTTRVRECRVFPGATVVTTLVCYHHTAHEAAGATGTRHSPRPLLGEIFMQQLGRTAPRERSRMDLPSLRGAQATKQSILRGEMDCFAEPVSGRRFAPTRWLAMTVSMGFGCSQFESVGCASARRCRIAARATASAAAVTRPRLWRLAGRSTPIDFSPWLPQLIRSCSRRITVHNFS